MMETPIIFQSCGLRLAGVLRYPEGYDEPLPAVLLVHGSLEQDRDGNLVRRRDGKPAFKKNFFLEISRRLSAEGFATFSWDRRGTGESEAPVGDDGGYLADVRDAKAAFRALSSQEGVDPARVAVLGQSSGVYTACLLAREEAEDDENERPAAYVLQGGLYRDYAEMMAFNYRRVVDYAQKSPENLRWVEENDLLGLVMGLNLSALEEGAKRGEVEHDLSYEGRTWRLRHDPICYLSEYAPKNQFGYIQKPTLIIHGGCDLNVPAEDGAMIEQDLKSHGNDDVELVIIPEADHSFQEIAESEDQKLKERMSLESFRRPYREEYFQALTSYLNRRL
jgi:dipeptidyl aminopeptidase/acylaminoacyl peptidase